MSSTLPMPPVEPVYRWAREPTTGTLERSTVAYRAPCPTCSWRKAFGTVAQARAARDEHRRGVHNDLGPVADRATAGAGEVDRLEAHAASAQRVATAAALTAAVASWYGPGLYGNALACGGVLTRSTDGVAHRSLPCGSRLRICYRARCALTRVVDRGPFVAGRTFDLTAHLARRLGFAGVGVVRWRPWP